jgi:hypothetical protein
MANDAGSTCTGTSWLPSSGAIWTGLSKSGTRRNVYQQFHWSATRLANLQSCRTNLTYEAQFWDNYSDHKAYLGKAITSGLTNLPKPDVHPRLDDPSGTINWSILTADAQQLKSSEPIYWTLLRTLPTHNSAATDTGMVQGKRGHRFPSWCYGPYCAFRDAVKNIVDPWTYSLPGLKTWTN